MKERAATPVTDGPLVDIADLHFGYGTRPILSGVTMQFGRGKVIAVMGGSGSGKTTILRLIGGQLKAGSGTVRVAGKEITSLGERELYAIRRRMGMLFQFGALFTDMSVFENVAFPLREHTDLSDELIRDLVLMKLNAVGLRGAHALMPREISGGMARRVALARAIALDPELILYDEPVRRSRPDLARCHRQPDPLADRCARCHVGPGDARRGRVARDRRLRVLHRIGQGRGRGHARRAVAFDRSVRAAIRRRRAGRAGAVPLPGAVVRVGPRPVRTMNAVAAIGGWTLAWVRGFGNGARFFAAILTRTIPALARFGLVRDQIHFVGNYSFVIIAVSGLFVGFVLGLQGYYTLQRYGSEQALGLLVALSLVRELGPVVTALLFAGRAGTSLTAEIGLMKAGEQLSAMEMMAVDPVKRVIVPRFLAGVIAMPILAALFSAVGIAGGYIVGVQLIGVDEGAFWAQMQGGVDVWRDVGNGVIKSFVFGIAVTFIALRTGFEASPTPEGVSRATTRTVVVASLTVLALDFILTALMFSGS